MQEKTFGRYGPLREIWMARTVPCFAFVVYRYKDDAEDACAGADGKEICQRRIRVTVARPRARQVRKKKDVLFITQSDKKCKRCP